MLCSIHLPLQKVPCQNFITLSQTLFMFASFPVKLSFIHLFNLSWSSVMVWRLFDVALFQILYFSYLQDFACDANFHRFLSAPKDERLQWRTVLGIVIHQWKNSVPNKIPEMFPMWIKRKLHWKINNFCVHCFQQ